MTHVNETRVYYEDTDAGGFVYYANYLKYAERGRTEWLRSIGLENKALMDAEGLGFVVRKIAADYHKPAFLDDLLEVQTEIVQLKKASIAMKQSIFCRNVLLFSLDVTLACINIETRKPARLPDVLLKGV